MSAPTTVTALVHSSTVVTAGVYGLIRMGASRWTRNIGCNFLLTLCILTFASRCFSGCLSFDLKRVVAITTLANLRIIIYILFSGRCFLAYLHLIRHAAVKSLTFISVAVSMGESGHSQDLRCISGNSSVLLVLCLALQTVQLGSGYTQVKHSCLTASRNSRWVARVSLRLGYYFFFFSLSRVACLIYINQSMSSPRILCNRGYVPALLKTIVIIGLLSLSAVAYLTSVYNWHLTHARNTPNNYFAFLFFLFSLRYAHKAHRLSPMLRHPTILLLSSSLFSQAVAGARAGDFFF